MSTLHAFLHPETPENQKVYISSRFKDEKGQPVPFEIRPVTEEESAAIRKRCTIYKKDGKTGQSVKELDSARYTRLFVIEGTVTPDFRASDLCEAYGVVDPEMVLGKMLLAGEYSKLADAISDLSGITDEAIAKVGEDAKN